MTVECKFNLNQYVYFMHQNVVRQEIIEEIDLIAFLNSDGKIIMDNKYKTSSGFSNLGERYLFNSKEELLKSL